MDLLNNNNTIPTNTANNSNNKILMATGKAVFSEKTFFLDNKNPPQLNAMLAEKIPKLGGKIDPFITKNTFCMVTNRPKTEWIPTQKMNGGIETDSPTPKLMLNVENSWSRGKLMLEKSGQTCKAMDTLELARAFNIRIIKSAKLIKFIDSQLGICNNLQRQQEANNNNEYCIGYTRQLTPPYIKVIDNSFKYRPNYKELPEWPTLNFDYTPELCPFLKPKPNTGKVSNENMRQSQQQQANNNMNPSLLSQEYSKTNTANTAGLKQYAMLTTPVLTCITTNTPQIQNNNKSINTTNQNQNKYIRKRNLIYCEICRKDYTDFQAHLQDEKHAKFLNNEDNFQELIGVINSLPPFFKEPIITENSTISTMLFINNNQQSSATTMMAMIDDQKLSTFTNFNGHQKHITSQSSPMTSLHSINAWSSASKNRSFVAIHDLLNEKNENCFNYNNNNNNNIININNSDENNANENNVSLSA